MFNGLTNLHETLARAATLPGELSVTLHVHSVPTETAMEWLQDGLLDKIEPGAKFNPPTGTKEIILNEEPRRKAQIVVFTDGPRRDA